MSYSDGGVGVRPVGDNRVVIIGVQIPFGEMVVLILKLVAASIPVYLILVAIGFMLAMVFGGIFAAMMGAV
jgi:hypothetical protein